MKYLLPDRLYQILKWLGLAACPAIAVFVGTVGAAWGWQHIEPTVITINAVGVLIAALIGVSQATAKHAEPSDDHSPETDTLPEDDGSGIRPMTAEEVAAVFEGGEDGD